MVFKELQPSDYKIRNFTVHKDYVFVSGGDVQVLDAIQGDGFFHSDNEQLNINGIYKRSLYNNINRLYYDTASYISEPSYSVSIPYGMIDSNLIHKRLHNRAKIISISRNYYGEKIRSGSIEINDLSRSIDLYDDGYGNLYDYAYETEFFESKSDYTIGNIFYEHGNFIITNTGSDYINLGDGNYTLKFEGTHKVYEYEVSCLIKESEFNGTLNPTAISGAFTGSESWGRDDGYILPQFTSSEFPLTTYITTVGLFDEMNNLLVVGKLAKPLKNFNELATNIIIRFDL